MPKTAVQLSLSINKASFFSFHKTGCTNWNMPLLFPSKSFPWLVRQVMENIQEMESRITTNLLMELQRQEKRWQTFFLHSDLMQEDTNRSNFFLFWFQLGSFSLLCWLFCYLKNSSEISTQWGIKTRRPESVENKAFEKGRNISALLLLQW